MVFFFFMFQVTFWLASSHFHMTDQDKCFVLKYCLAFDIISKASKVCNKWLEYSFIKLLVVWNFVKWSILNDCNYHRNIIWNMLNIKWSSLRSTSDYFGRVDRFKRVTKTRKAHAQIGKCMIRNRQKIFELHKIIWLLVCCPKGNRKLDIFKIR